MLKLFKGEDIPTPFVGETVAEGAHVLANNGPFCAADDANVLDGQNCEEKILVRSIVPVLAVHHLCESKQGRGPKVSGVASPQNEKIEVGQPRSRSRTSSHTEDFR